MMDGIGVNALIQGISLEPLIAFNAEARSPVHVVIDEPKAAAALLAQGSQVIYRWSDDDHAHERHQPKPFVQRLHAEAPAGCVLQLGNEPGRQSLELLDAWTVSALDECERLGRKAGIFAFATGEPEPDDWKRMRRSVEQARTGGHWLILHEYFDGYVRRSVPWHIGRFNNAYAVFGAGTPQIVIGELACAVNYNPYAGWQTYLTAEQYAAELIEAQGIYAPRGIPSCVFVWGPWDRTTTFEIRGEAVIHRAIIDYNAGREEDDMVPGYGRARTKQAGANVNLRGGPGLKHAPVGVVRTGDWVKRLPGSTVAADGYTWAQIALDRDAGSHQHGWVATEVIEV